MGRAESTRLKLQMEMKHEQIEKLEEAKADWMTQPYDDWQKDARDKRQFDVSPAADRCRQG